MNRSGFGEEPQRNRIRQYVLRVYNQPEVLTHEDHVENKKTTEALRRHFKAVYGRTVPIQIHTTQDQPTYHIHPTLPDVIVGPETDANSIISYWTRVKTKAEQVLKAPNPVPDSSPTNPLVAAHEQMLWTLYHNNQVNHQTGSVKFNLTIDDEAVVDYAIERIALVRLLIKGDQPLHIADATEAANIQQKTWFEQENKYSRLGNFREQIPQMHGIAEAIDDIIWKKAFPLHTILSEHPSSWRRD